MAATTQPPTSPSASPPPAGLPAGQPLSPSQPGLLMSDRFKPGQRLRVTQQVVRQLGAVTGTVEGTLIKFEQQKTGSWFAHSKDGKLWLDRLELRKDDGELITLNVDQFTHIDVLSA